MPITKLTNETTVQCSAYRCAVAALEGLSHPQEMDTYLQCECNGRRGDLPAYGTAAGFLGTYSLAWVMRNIAAGFRWLVEREQPGDPAELAAKGKLVKAVKMAVEERRGGDQIQTITGEWLARRFDDWVRRNYGDLPPEERLALWNSIGESARIRLTSGQIFYFLLAGDRVSQREVNKEADRIIREETVVAMRRRRGSSAGPSRPSRVLDGRSGPSRPSTARPPETEGGPRDPNFELERLRRSRFGPEGVK